MSQVNCLEAFLYKYAAKWKDEERIGYEIL